MYEQRFGLHRKPFQTVTKEQDFFASSSFGELLPGVVHALQTDLGVAVLTGPAGVGKSVSLEQIQRHLESRAQTLLLRGGSLKGSGDLLYLLHRKLLKIQPATANEADIKASDIGRRYEVVERLERVASFWGPLTILLDDAHLICGEVFAELRSLLEEGHDGQRFARLLIAGPLSLEEVLAESENSHFARKIRTHAFLQPLRSDESIQYLKHLFELAGGDLSTAFESKALELISGASDGIPQCLNLLADESLMVCEETDTETVTRDVVNQALTRLQHLPYSWNVSMVSEDDDDGFEEPPPASGKDTLVTDNAIEFGDFPSASMSPSGNRSVGPVASGGVIEIGGPVSASEAPPRPLSPDVVTSVEEDAVFEMEFESADALESVLVDSHKVEVLNETCQIADVEQMESSLEDAIAVSAKEFADLDDSGTFDHGKVDEPVDSSDVDIDVDVNQLAEFVDEEFDQNLQVDSQDEGVSEAIRNFQPWAPAGQWPVEHPAVEPSRGGVAEDEASIMEPAEVDSEVDGQVSEVAASMHSPDDAGVTTSLTQTLSCDNAEPVMDRFTMVEFGREPEVAVFKSAEEIDAPFQDQPVFQSSPSWPPTVSGLAPSSQIPVSGLDDDYAELLNDLGLLIDATAERSLPVENLGREMRNAPTHEKNESEPYGELLGGANGPEGTIAELQQLIQEEQKLDISDVTTDQISETASLRETNEEAATEPVEADTSTHAPHASPQFFSMNQVEEDGIQGHSDPGKEASGDPEGTPSGVGMTAPDGHDPDVVAFHQIAEERDEWYEQQMLLAEIENETEAQKQSLPSALRQARKHHQRVLSIGLRQAAGAETVAAVPVEDMTGAECEQANQQLAIDDQDRPISLLMPEASGAAAEFHDDAKNEELASHVEESVKSGFANLFTRLRRRRGKAS